MRTEIQDQGKTIKCSPENIPHYITNVSYKELHNSAVHPLLLEAMIQYFHKEIKFKN
jgi:hypothetical protein